MTDLINLVYPSKRINHPRLSLRANFSWTFIGNLIYALSQWGILISLAKLGNPGTVGQFVLGLAITGPLFMFFSLELSNVQAADAIHQHSFNQYFSLRLFTTVLALLVLSACAPPSVDESIAAAKDEQVTLSIENDLSRGQAIFVNYQMLSRERSC